MRAIFILFITIFLNTLLFAQWEQVTLVEGGPINSLRKVGDRLYAGTDRGMFCSFDDGYSWSRVADIPEDFKIEIIQTGSGFITVGASRRTPGIDTQVEFYLLYAPLSGQNWIIRQMAQYDNGNSYYYPSISILQRGSYWFFGCKAGLFRSLLDLGNPVWTQVSAHQKFTAGSGVIRIWGYGGEPFGTYFSDDFGETWTQKNIPYNIRDLRTFSGRMVLLGTNKIYISDDEATSWTLAYSGIVGSTDTRIDRGPSGTLYIGVAYAYLRSTDNGATWESVPYLGNGLVESICFEETASGDLLVGSLQALYRLAPGSNVPQWSQTGLSAGSVSTVLASSDTLFARNWRINWLTPDQEMPFSQWTYIGPVGDYRAGIYRNKLYRVAYKLEYTTDLGQNWQIAYQDYGQYSEGLQVKGDKIYVSNYDFMVRIDAETHAVEDTLTMPEVFAIFDIQQVGNALFLMLPEQGRIYRSFNGGDTWELVKDDWLCPFNNWPSLSASIGNRLLLLSTDGLLATDDMGSTFNQVVPQADAIVQIANRLYIAAPGEGMLVSTDLGNTWAPAMDGLPTTEISMCYAAGNLLYAATQHHGIWRLPVDMEAVKGHVFLDANQNGQRDAGEGPFPGAVLQAQPSGQYAASGYDGAFTLFKPAGTDTLHISSTLPFVQFSPAYQVASGGDFGLEYAAQFDGGYLDLSVDMANLTVFRPGFANALTLTVRNLGSEPADPVLKLFSLEELEFLGATPAPDWSSADSLVWQLPTLAPLEVATILMEVRTPVSTPIGSVVSVHTRVEPVTGDQQTGNNSDRLTEEVVGSYDPNDKRVQPEVLNVLELSDTTTLTYTIRFQNTGNYPAEFVRITDTLSPWLDPASIYILSHSHPMRWSLSGNGALEFFFDNIQLPDSSSNEPESHGFVRFSIRPRAGLSLGDTVANTAYIYFDYNEAIVTNTAHSTVTLPSALHEAIRTLHIDVAPNPARNHIRLIPAMAGDVRVFDVQGRQVLHGRLTGSDDLLDVSVLPQGSYRLWLQNGRERYWGVFLVLEK